MSNPSDADMERMERAVSGLRPVFASDVRHVQARSEAKMIKEFDLYSDRLYDLEQRITGIPAVGSTDLLAHLNLETDIPADLQEFYKKVGYFIHPATDKPVKKLTWYQQDSWNDRQHAKYRLYLKSQKIGMTSYFLLEDLHIALTQARGKEILIVAQTKDKAEDHLQTLRAMIRDSPSYSSYLIESTKDADWLLPGQRSKKDELYLHNPDDPKRPTRIVALGITSVGSLISFKKVTHIHMSDITMAEQSEKNAKAAHKSLTSRLANTRGTIVIECPPRGPVGPIWQLVNQAPELRKEGYRIELDEAPVDIKKRGFRVRRLPYQYGIKAGLITEEFINEEKESDPALFSMLYETDFYSSETNFFPKELVNKHNPYAKEQAEIINRVQAYLATNEQNLDGEPIKTYQSDLKYTNPEEWKRRQEAERNASKFRDQSVSADGRSGTGERMGNIADNEIPMTETERNQAIKESIENEKDDTERIKRLSSKRHIRNAFGIKKKRNSKKG